MRACGERSVPCGSPRASRDEAPAVSTCRACRAYDFVGTRQRFSTLSPGKQASIVETAIGRATRKQQDQRQVAHAGAAAGHGQGAEAAGAAEAQSREKGRIVSGEELVDKCERLLQALAKTRASGNYADYPQDLVESELRGLYVPQVEKASLHNELSVRVGSKVP